jgi:hypothetical protein
MIVVRSPVRSPEAIAGLYDRECQPCEHFIQLDAERGRCGLCGCGLKRYPGAWFNKLEWATTQCPAKPPRWT